ncbi:MAG: bifunctional folylpolyglutamate synthase/dihydrofolate synthase [Planctomycetota bacterium]|jgi:dihydrofolate synthase/folylpolyglutamate synthase|nr:bifunctional folylpolyglutamate synthase/dihydrofolate synthase [Planctomycetota bacterium]
MDKVSTPNCYQEAIARLDSFTNYERLDPSQTAFGLERMITLLRRLDSPHLFAPAVHLAGTKGKGSTAFLVAAALQASGLRTGLYLSPHVENLRERILLNNVPLGENAFATSVLAATTLAEELRQEGSPPTYFEVLTASAFHAFRKLEVDVVVLETGLGGRLDATNIPDLRVFASGITPISLDHEEILGDNLEDIALEKAGIIRHRVPLVIGQQTEAVMRILAKRAEETGAPVYRFGRELRLTQRRGPLPDRPDSGQVVDLETWRSRHRDISLALLGDHQAANALTALGISEAFLEKTGRPPLESAKLERAWRHLTLPARLEVCLLRPWTVVDGAHNPASAWAAAETLLATFSSQKRHLVFGAAADKKVEAMLNILAPLFQKVFITPFASPRGRDQRRALEFMRANHPDIPTQAVAEAGEAINLARSGLGAEGLVLVSGSLYLAGEARAYCRHLAAAGKRPPHLSKLP